MKIRNSSLSFLATLALAGGMISWGTALNAQTTPSTPSQTQQPDAQPTPDTPPTQQTPQTQQAPMPDTPPAAQTPDQTQTPDQRQTPDSKAAPSATAPSATDSQSFSGTVVKSGDKYMLKDDAGKTYDIDHQDEVKKFEGKRVKVQGTLDATGTKITVK